MQKTMVEGIGNRRKRLNEGAGAPWPKPTVRLSCLTPNESERSNARGNGDWRRHSFKFPEAKLLTTRTLVSHDLESAVRQITLDPGVPLPTGRTSIVEAGNEVGRFLGCESTDGSYGWFAMENPIDLSEKV
jgi:hypothetical protein